MQLYGQFSLLILENYVHIRKRRVLRRSAVRFVAGNLSQDARKDGQLTDNASVFRQPSYQFENIAICRYARAPSAETGRNSSQNGAHVFHTIAKHETSG